MIPPFRAEIHGPTAIRFTLRGVDRPVDPSAYRLTDGAGEPLPVAEILPNTDVEALLVPGTPLDPARLHYLELPEAGLRTPVRREPWFRSLYSSKELGARVSAGGRRTTFRLFSPRAHAVRLYLYAEKDAAPEDARAVVELAKDSDGVWETVLDGNLHGAWYDFTVHGPADPGDWFYEEHPVHVSDPWALVNDDALGKSRVWRDGGPPPPVAGGRPAMEDVVAYEVHVQDFTDLLPVEDPGTLDAFARAGLVNGHGEPVGLDHLVAMGVNVVHLMPVQEYLHHPDATWREIFAEDPFAREMGIAEENYQWGYRTTHAFAVESRFRAPDAEPGSERDAFRALVRAFHERGIAVVVDVVPNHTGENMDGMHLLLGFNVLDLPYFYRTDDEMGHIGPFGNEVKSEERPMVQRWILDQLRHWVEALGVDGFRIDMAGQIDRQTLLLLRRELPGDLLVYGEPWIPPSDARVVAEPGWSWYKADAPITFFQDDVRNALQGSPFEVRDRGWAGGSTWLRGAAMQALVNGYEEEPVSTAGISYLDIHDNWSLADRYAANPDHDGRAGVDLAAVRRAAGLLLTSVGPVVLHGGSEMLRSKGLAPRSGHRVEIPGGSVAFHGRHDTYNLRAPNRFLWESLEPGSDAAAMRDWWAGLVRLRLSEEGAVFRVREVPDGHYRFLTPKDPSLLGYVVGGRILVLVNTGAAAGVFSFQLRRGDWIQVVDEERVDPGGVGGPMERIPGGAHTLEVPGGAFLVWVRR